ncbi:MAG: RNA polymerase sigma factor [Candidatus Methylacidiphilales bacterium]
MSVQTDNTTFDEAEALKLAQESRAEGWEMLHRQYYRGLWAAAHHVVRDETLAEDVVQSAFLKAFKQIRSFKGDSKFSTWIYRITLNQALDLVRQRQRRNKVLGLFPLSSGDDDEAPEVEAVDPRTGADRLQEKDLGAAIRSAMASLTREQRVVVELRLIQGFSTEETARMLGCKKGTVLSRLYYACQNLKEKLGNQYEEL